MDYLEKIIEWHLDGLNEKEAELKERIESSKESLKKLEAELEEVTKNKLSLLDGYKSVLMQYSPIIHEDTVASADTLDVKSRALMEGYKDITIEVKVEESKASGKPITKTIKLEESSVSDRTIIAMLIYVAGQIGIKPKDIYDFINEKREEAKRKKSY